MNNENNRKLVAGLIVLVGILVIVLILVFALKGKTNNDTTGEQKNYQELEDGTKKNTSSEVSKVKTIGDIKIEQASLVYKNSESVLTVNVTNNGADQSNLRISIKYIGNDGNVLETSLGYVGKILKNETKQITAGINTDVANIKDIQYEIMQ